MGPSPDGRMFRLAERGGTKDLRECARAGELTCPVRGCLAPEFDLAARPVRRHSFRHRQATKGATGHNRETADHVSAKHLIRAWVESRGAVARVEAPVSGGLRVADVLATLPYILGGGDVVFEVQYAQVPVVGPKGLPARSGDYAALGLPRWYASRP